MRVTSATTAAMRRGLRLALPAAFLIGSAIMMGSTGPAPDAGRSIAPQSPEAGSPPQAVDLSELVNESMNLRASELVELELDAMPGEPLRTTLPIAGIFYTLDLMPYSVRSADYRLRQQLADGSIVTVVPGPERTLRGVIDGVPGSAVGASLLEDGLYAVILLPDGEKYWLEPVDASLPAARPGLHVLYHNDDMISPGGLCGVDAQWIAEKAALGHGALPFHDEPAAGEGPDFPPGPLAGQHHCAELACDADYYYYLSYGSVEAVENRINAVINAVNTQYQDDVDIHHVITEIIVRTTQTYNTNNPEQLLYDFRARWQSQHGNVPRDMAHLFTGRNLNGSVIGIAFLSAVCTSYGYGLVQSDCCGGFGCSTDLSAHEMGHNWGADHCSCPTYTMNPSLTCSNRFNPTYTIPDIVGYRNGISGCLEICNPDGPENDDCGSNIEAFEGVTVFSTVEATTDGPDEPEDCSFNGSSHIESDVWFQFHPLEICQVTVSLCGSLFDTKLAVYVGCPDGPGEVIACNDDFCDEQSEVTFIAPQLFNLQVRIGSPTGEQGQGIMVITTTPINPLCPADFDDDGDVDTNDLLLLLGAWGTSGPDGDVDEDGDVDTEDLLALLAAWGDC